MEHEKVNRIGLAILFIPFLILVMAIISNADIRLPVLAHSTSPTGNAELGLEAIQRYGCGACHTIPGVPGANAMVGPLLTGLSQRSFLAGELSNTPEHLVQWIRNPQAIKPGTAMPDMGIDEPTAQNIAAYLYTLK